MSASNRTPFQDITNEQKKDPKEVKKERDKEWYAKNKDEILKRRRQSRELKKQSMAPGQSGVTQQQYIAHAGGAAPILQQSYASHIDEPESLELHGGISLVVAHDKSEDPKEVKRQRDRERYAKNKDEILKRRRQSRELKKQSMAPMNDVTNEDESEGLHRNDASQNILLKPILLTPLSDQLGTTSSGPGDCGPVTGVINMHIKKSRRVQKQHSGQGWYARLSDEKKSEYLQRQRIARQQKKATTRIGVNSVEVSQTSAASLRSSQRAPLSNVTNTHTNSTQQASCQQNNTPEDTPGIGEIESTCSFMARDLHSPSNESAMIDDDDNDWPHKNDTYMRNMISLKEPHDMSAYPGMHGQDSFVVKSAYLDKKRQHDSSEETRKRHRERYSLMTDGQRDVRLRKNREYKKSIRGTKTRSDHDGIVATIAGSTFTSRCTPIIQAQPSKHHQTGDTHSDEDYDPTGIFEPIEQGSILGDNLTAIQEEQEEQGMNDFDEECRIFSGQGDVFDSYILKSDVAPSNQNDDPYGSVYHNLPTKHHVLKPVKDCVHCGAMRIQYEGPAFCCRKGKVKIVIPEVPQELRRLFTSQDDEDAIYFRKHIRYFNTHFSFTSLGVTLDHKVSNAERTGVYTFRAQGGLYHKMDNLVPGGQGPRHLQLYIYDTDETLEHRVKRSPDLDINLIRKILQILENNPYVQIFKSIGSVPNLEEYRISLNTDIRLDQRRYNAPTASQVAAMWVEGSGHSDCRGVCQGRPLGFWPSQIKK